MPNNLVKQWVEMGQASLRVLKQVSESDTSNFGDALQQQFGSSDVATVLKAALDSSRQLGDINVAIFTSLFHNQLKLLNLGVAGTAMQELTEANTTFVNSFVQKQMKMVNDFTAMFATYLSDLQKTQGMNDIALLQTGFLNDLEQKLKDNANDLGQLLLSAKTASTAWTERTLNKTINDG